MLEGALRPRQRSDTSNPAVEPDFIRLDDIVVTAQRREQDRQHVPTAIAVDRLDAQAMEKNLPHRLHCQRFA